MAGTQVAATASEAFDRVVDFLESFQTLEDPRQRVKVLYPAAIGPAMIALVEAILKAKPHPEQGFRAAKGILRLATSYGVTRMEAAAERGNDIGAVTYGSILSILKNGLDKAYAPSTASDAAPIQHANIRGRGYYH